MGHTVLHTQLTLTIRMQNLATLHVDQTPLPLRLGWIVVGILAVGALTTAYVFSSKSSAADEALTTEPTTVTAPPTKVTAPPKDVSAPPKKTDSKKIDSKKTGSKKNTKKDGKAKKEGKSSGMGWGWWLLIISLVLAVA